MIRIPLTDARVSRAYEILKKEQLSTSLISLSSIFEDVHRCKIIADPNDVFCLTGWVEMSDEKYYTWFALKFGDNIE